MTVPHSEAVYPVPELWKRRGWLDNAAYHRDYQRSLHDAQSFWAEQAEQLDWFHSPTRTRDVSYGPQDIHIRWFEDGVLNVSTNCLDRHLPERAHKHAIVWEGDDPTESRTLSYAELHAATRKEIGPIAAPDQIRWAQSLPMTRSGKIMRRVLRKIAADDTSDLGDTSTLADATMVDGLIDGRRSIVGVAP